MAAIFFRPRFVYNDGAAQDFSMLLSQRPWDYGSQGVGGSDTSAAGVPASFEIRRDYFLHLSLRFTVAEWAAVDRLVRHFQAGGSATFYPDQNEVALTATVYGVSPAMGEEIRPTRSGENKQTLELNITVRRTTSAIFEDAYYPTPAFTFPDIDDIEYHWDAELQTEADLATVSPWTDQSGNANHATLDGGTPQMLTSGWSSGVRAIKMLNNENFVFTATPLHNKPLTLFFVFEATNLTLNMALIGSYASSTAPRYPSVFVRTDGRLVWTFSNDPYTCVTATGVIVATNRYVVTARQSNTAGMVLRVNGVEKKAEPTATTPNVQWAPGSVGLCRDVITGGVGGNFYLTEALFAEFIGYSKAASDDEVDQMEGFLGQKWAISIG